MDGVGLDGVIVLPSVGFEEFGSRKWETGVMIEESVACRDETIGCRVSCVTEVKVLVNFLKHERYACVKESG